MFNKFPKGLLSIVLAGLWTSALTPQDQPAYTSWLTGDAADVVTPHREGTILMGGSTDVDAAHTWMINNAAGGDVVILRASGKDGYNPYLWKLGRVNSVETLLVNSREIANHPEIADKVRKAEAIFIAGGDQANYVRFWNHTLLSEALQYVISKKKITIGGTSAGCAILGGLYFGAPEGSVTSEEALGNAHHKAVVIDYHDFLKLNYLKNAITDTHYDARHRIGRHIVFMARAYNDRGIKAHGIGVSEKTAVCIDSRGIGTVFGSGVAYFLSPLSKPDKLSDQGQLNWPEGVKSVEVKGDSVGNQTFDVKRWKPVTSAFESRVYSVNHGQLSNQLK